MQFAVGALAVQDADDQLLLHHAHAEGAEIGVVVADRPDVGRRRQ
jgi:hypothetical protein